MINIYDTTLTALVDWTEEPAPYWNRTQKRSLAKLFALACGQDFDEDWLLHTPRRTLLLTAPSHA